MAAGWTMVVVVVSLHLDPRPPAPSLTAALIGMASASYHGTSEEPLKTLAAAQGLDSPPARCRPVQTQPGR